MYIDLEVYFCKIDCSHLCFSADSLLEQIWDVLYDANLDYEEPWAIYNSSTITCFGKNVLVSHSVKSWFIKQCYGIPEAVHMDYIIIPTNSVFSFTTYRQKYKVMVS